MNNTNGNVTSKSGTSGLVSPIFGPGMLLQHEDLEQLNSYTRELSRLLFRSFFGCGVVCGLRVRVTEEKCNKVCVSVDAGLALDCAGDPIHVPTTMIFPLDENCNIDTNKTTQLAVILCGQSKSCAPRNSMCASDDDEATSQCTRARASFEIRVVSTELKCACGLGTAVTPRTEHTFNANPNTTANEAEFWMADPNTYKDHYCGDCSCNCGEDAACACNCVLLARLNWKDTKWEADCSVRRFIRPVLMRDPVITCDTKPASPQPQPATTPALQNQQTST